jgi:hypothetical protein
LAQLVLRFELGLGELRIGELRLGLGELRIGELLRLGLRLGLG